MKKLFLLWVSHCIERYGKAEVDSWYWEWWNEPNTEDQIAALEQSGGLAMLQAPTRIASHDKEFTVTLQLPRQAVSLIKIVLH